MANKQEVELLIRATDQNSKATFDAVAKSIDTVSQSLTRQVAAAEKGEVSAADLAATMKTLQGAAAELLKQQNLVNFYENLAAKLALATEKSEAQRNKLEELRAATANSAEVTSKQATALAKQETAVTKADAAVERATVNLVKQAGVLERVGIDATKLDTVNNALATSMTRVGQALTVTNATLDGYQEKLERLANAKDQEAEATRAATAAAEQRQRVNDMRYIDALTEALEREELAVRSVAEAQKNSEALASFQAQADRALAASRGLETFTVAGKQASEATSLLRDKLAGITQPTAVMIQNINGLESRIAELSKTVGDGTQPFRNYQEASLGLSVAQQALLRQASLVDNFKAQQAAVTESAAAYELARNEVLSVAAAMKAAEVPSAELTERLKQAETGAVLAGNALAREQGKLESLSGSLRKAMIDTDNLAAAENRLKVSANQAAEAQSKIANAGTKAGKDGPLGLSPYALTNLGYQLNDVFTQIASGTSVMQTAAQQGGQILQIFPGVFAAIAGLLPIILPVVAGFALLYGALKRITDLKQDVKDFQKAIDASADGATYNAKNLAMVSRELQDIGVKSKDAKAALLEFVDKGIAPDQLIRFGRAARDVAEITGKTVPDAAARLAEGFSAGYDAIKKLDDEFNFLTLAEREHIKAMFESGDAAGARARAFQDFYDRNEAAAAKARGPWASAWISLKSAVAQFLDYVGEVTKGSQVVLFFDFLAEKIDTLATKLKDLSAQATSSAALVNSTSDADMEQVVKTVMMEGGRDARSQQAVAEVIGRRAQLSGTSLLDVINKPGQFEARNNPADRKKLDAIDTNSTDYKYARARTIMAMRGDLQEVAPGAVNFYSPAGNQARAADGRPLVPGFAQGKTPVATIAGQQYFGGTFPGMRPQGAAAAPAANPADTVKAAQDRAKATKEELDAQQLIYDAQNKQTDEIRLQNAELKERMKITNAGGDDKSDDGKRAIMLARAVEQKKIDDEHDAQRKSLLAALTAAETANAAAQEQSLNKRLNAITEKFKALKVAADKASSEGLREVAPGQTVDQYKAQLDTQEKIAKNNETLKFYEEQLNSLLNRRSEMLKSIQAQQDIGAITQAQALQQMTDANAKLAPLIVTAAENGQKFAQSIRGAVPDPKLESLITKFTNAKGLSDSDFFNLGSKSIGTEIDRLQSELKIRLDRIKEDVQNGAITPAEAVTKAQDAVDQIAPKVKQLAEDAEKFAKAFSSLSNGATSAFVAKAQAASSSDSSKGPKGPVGDVGAVAEATATARLNELLEQRSTILQLNQQLVDNNAMTIGEAEASNQKAYADTNADIRAQIETLKQLNDTLHDTGQRSDEAYSLMATKLKLVEVQSRYTSAEMKQLRNTIVTSFVSGAVSAIDEAAEALGRFVTGGEKATDTLRDIGRAALGFVAQFLKDMANVILQMLALRAIKALLKMDDGGDPGVKGGALLLAASVAWTFVAQQIQAAADTMIAAASLEIAASFFHGGGVIGSSSGQTRGGVSPLAWVGAPRYHSGTGGPLGMKPNERAAILELGEEVLSKESPRNIRNMGGAKNVDAGVSGGGRPLRQVLAIGQDQIAKAMKGAHGEEVIVTHISNNRETVRQLLGIG